MTPEQYVQDKAQKSGSSFYYAFMFLPPARRAAMTAFYAFCREVDDVADDMQDPGVAATKLAWWRKEVETSFAGTPRLLVKSALNDEEISFSSTRSCGRFGPAMLGCTVDRSSSSVSVNTGSG